MTRDILSTDRLRLREITPADLPFLHRIFGDEECMRYYPGIKTFDETESWFRRLAFDSYTNHGFGLWAVVDRKSGALLGDCGITLQETSAGLEPEIGYHLWRDHWGKGYAVEAATAGSCAANPWPCAHRLDRQARQHSLPARGRAGASTAGNIPQISTSRRQPDRVLPLHHGQDIELIPL
ncbi:hypothetical protein FHS26_003458 [Rhizobium pisi]|uniref:N-acetyltransferase domain-containing protein n=1 Tax=Rhizobium pisi TaxID=574561 RepID=A0A7W5BML1_9HYPH|nr:hypothetical protein [Rhizobium pisi]